MTDTALETMQKEVISSATQIFTLLFMNLHIIYTWRCLLKKLQTELPSQTHCCPTLTLWCIRRWTEHLKNGSSSSLKTKDDHWNFHEDLVKDCFSLHKLFLLGLTRAPTCVSYEVYWDQKQSFHWLQLPLNSRREAVLTADFQHESLHIYPYLNSCPTGIMSNS